MTAQDKSLMRCLGEFVGHVWTAIRQPAGTRKQQLRHETQETRKGEVVLRRTVIEEVEITAATAGGEQETCS